MAVSSRVPTCLGVVALLAVTGCVEVHAPADHGAGVTLQIAPLGLDGVDEALWDVIVENGDTPRQTVWSARLSSTRFGDGAGSVTYVGPCDASEGASDNRVSLRLIGLYAGNVAAPGGYGDIAPVENALDFRDPGTMTREVTCLPNADVTVDFNVTIIRPANQGFFDVAVNFADIFCSAKYDCTAADLLFDELGARARTHVLGMSCTTGEAADTETVLYLDDIVIDCGAGGTATLDPGAGPGNYRAMSAPAGEQWHGAVFTGGFNQLFQVASYRGVTPASGGLGVETRYWNLALGVAGSLAGCTLTTAGTADDAAAAGGAQGGVVEIPDVYPYIVWDVDLGACAENHALDAAGSEVFTSYLGPGEGYAFAHGYPGATSPADQVMDSPVGAGLAPVAFGWVPSTLSASNPSANLPVTSAYIFNDSGGGNMTVTYVAQGHYRVTVPGLDLAGKHIEVGAYTASNPPTRCNVDSVNPITHTFDVRCRGNAGSDVNTQFHFGVFGAGSGVSYLAAYASAPLTTDASTVLQTAFSGDGETHQVTLNRDGPGSYSVAFGGLTLLDGNVQVTAVGSNTLCVVVAWHSGQAYIRCVDTGLQWSSDAVDSAFTVSFVRQGTSIASTPPGTLAYALTDDPTDDVTAPAEGQWFNSAGMGIGVTRTGLGVYEVRFGGLDLEDAVILAHSWGSEAYCNAQGWAGDTAIVACFSPHGGVPADARFSIRAMR